MELLTTHGHYLLSLEHFRDDSGGFASCLVFTNKKYRTALCLVGLVKECKRISSDSEWKLHKVLNFLCFNKMDSLLTSHQSVANKWPAHPFVTPDTPASLFSLVSKNIVMLVAQCSIQKGWY